MLLIGSAVYSYFYYTYIMGLDLDRIIDCTDTLHFCINTCHADIAAAIAEVNDYIIVTTHSCILPCLSDVLDQYVIPFWQ